MLTLQEEQKIIDHILWKKSIGYGVTLEMIQLLLQKVFLAVTEANPDCISYGFRDCSLEPCSP